MPGRGLAKEGAVKKLIRKWNPRKDAACCIGCGNPFKRSEEVSSDDVVTIHYRYECVKQYLQDCKDLGLKPAFVIAPQ